MVDAQLPKNSSGTLVIERDNDQDRNDRVAEFNLKKKQKYQPNISAFLAVCGRNYAHILKWLPEQINVNVPWQVDGEFGTLSINLIENTKYTQLIEISRPIPNGHFFKSPKAIVRIYHDAQLAEVLTSQQIYRLKPVYDYPNLHMHHSDEKFQVNAFLEELLKIGSRRVSFQS